MHNDSWPLRRSDALFVVVVVLFLLPSPGPDASFGIPATAKVVLVVAGIAAWIRFRVFGHKDRGDH